MYQQPHERVSEDVGEGNAVDLDGLQKNIGVVVVGEHAQLQL